MIVCPLLWLPAPAGVIFSQYGTLPRLARLPHHIRLTFNIKQHHIEHDVDEQLYQAHYT